MAKLTIILDTRRANKNGQYLIRLQLTNNRSNTTISTGYSTSPEHFVGRIDQIVTNSSPMANHINLEVQKLYLDVLSLLNELERKGNINRASASTIKEHLERMSNKTTPIEEVSFTSAIDTYIQQCRAPKTAQGYTYAKNMLHTYTGKKKVYFDDITFSFLDSFDRWMERKGMAINTRSIVFRNIRTVFNYAIKNDTISQNIYPFRKFEIKRAKKEKDTLTLQEMQSIAALNLTGELKQAQDFFLLSFYLCGINPIDLFQLYKPNKKGIVSFIRKKIAHKEPEPIHLTVPEEAKHIIERYQGTEHLLQFKEKHAYDTFIRRIERNIERIGDMLDLHLYMYIARYTWATFADHLGVPHEVISKALGHTDSTTAERYYISFNWDKVTKANRQVIDYLHGK